MGTSVSSLGSRRARAASGFRLSHALLVVAVLGLGVGCSGYVKRGTALYADGRYIEAAEVFERTEHRLNESNPKQQAEYGLYRGLTLLVLGDTGGARRWLSYAYQVERANPGILRGNRRSLLDRGWVELQSRGELPPGPVAPAMAAQPMPPTLTSMDPAPPPGPSPAPPARRSLMPQ